MYIQWQIQRRFMGFHGTSLSVTSNQGSPAAALRCRSDADRGAVQNLVASAWSLPRYSDYRTGRKFRGDKISCFVLAPLNSNVRGYLFSRYSLLYVASTVDRWAYQQVKISWFYLVPRKQRNFMTREIFCLYGMVYSRAICSSICSRCRCRENLTETWSKLIATWCTTLTYLTLVILLLCSWNCEKKNSKASC